MSTGSKITSAAESIWASRLNNCAKLLAEARIQRVRLAELPREARPQTTGDAYLCQELLIQHLLEHYGGSVIGYKIACTNKIAQDLLHMPGPFYGKMLSSFCYDTPARIKASPFFMRVIEAEFAFLIGKDGTIEAVLPGIEIVDSRFNDWTTVGAESLISDNACHAAWVRGEPSQNWRDFNFAAQEVRLFVNGNLTQTGSGAAVLGSPLNALEWLKYQVELKPGEYVTTGVTTDIYMGQPGDEIIADFGALGKVQLTFD